jgi:type III secretion system-like peptide-binding chaperone
MVVELDRLEWTDFARRMADALARLPVGAFVVVQGADGFPYVQAMRYRNGLHAEAVSNAFLPRKLDAAQDRRMVALGWQPPDGERRLNWWSRVILPGDPGEGAPAQQAECESLADRMMQAFRQVYGVSAPDDLAYQAARNGTGAGPLALPELGLAPVAEPQRREPPAERREPPAPRREPSPERRPADPLEPDLTAAKERGDQQGYFKLMLDAELCLPLLDGGEYALGRYNNATYVLAFTSVPAMEQARGGPVEDFRRIPFTELARDWPNPDWQLAINTRLTSAAFVDSATLRRFARHTAKPRVMAKVVRPDQVTHYVDGGYDWVAGRIHRVGDVQALATPDRLVRELGLEYPDSPFSADAAELHVIIWRMVKINPVRLDSGGDVPAYRIPSRRLTHGARLHRIDRSGVQTLVAVYDADQRKWVRR